jgi:hypothetical protein
MPVGKYRRAGIGFARGAETSLDETSMADGALRIDIPQPPESRRREQ